jgi:hypothetical protein
MSHLPTTQGNILLHPEEVQKAVQEDLRVPITTHHLQEADLPRHIAADLPVPNQEVPIHQALHRGHHPVLRPVLHQGGIEDKNYRFNIY